LDKVITLVVIKQTRFLERLNGRTKLHRRSLSKFVSTDSSQVIDDPSSLGKYYGKLAEHFASIGDLQSAEKFYLDAGLHKEAIEMYNNAGSAHQSANYLEKELFRTRSIL
jgi:hypothetical protein